MSDDILKNAQERMVKSVGHIREEMTHIRTGKATTSLLDGIKVDYYGTPTPLKQIAGINAPEPRLLVVMPYDKGSFQAVEKALLASDLGLTPQNDGKVIRLPIPMLTAERREELTKVVRRIAEEGRVAVRNVRRDANEHIKHAEKEGTLSKDEVQKLLDRIQKETDNHIHEIDQVLKARETEIREE
jgi:ribosome recycling factor